MNIRRLSLRFLLPAFLVGLSVTLPLVLAGGDVNHAITRGTVSAPPKILPTTEVVSIGIEPTQVSNVNLGSGTWEMSFYLWWRWRGPIDPVTSTYVTNATGASTNSTISYSFTDGNKEAPKLLANGEHYQQAYISLGFSDAFPMQRYPLDVQNLELRIENTTYDYHQLAYVVDRHASTDQSLVVPGWKVRQIVYGAYMHHYNTDFGNIEEGPAFQNYSLVTFDIVVNRPVSHFLGKLLIPLMVVILAALSALMLKASNFDTRLALTGTGLLTLIFLQQGYSADLPNPVPFVLMDKIYALAYGAVLVTFFRVIWTTDRVHRKEHDEMRYVKGDRILAAILFAALVAGTTIFIVVA